jgi:hypothetical protein
LQVISADCPLVCPGLSASHFEEIYVFWTETSQQG